VIKWWNLHDFRSRDRLSSIWTDRHDRFGIPTRLSNLLKSHPTWRSAYSRGGGRPGKPIGTPQRRLARMALNRGRKIRRMCSDLP
jgi:hypothetical protein